MCFDVLGGNWDPTDKKVPAVNSCRQDLLPTCKAAPKETNVTSVIQQRESHACCLACQVWYDLVVPAMLHN